MLAGHYEKAIDRESAYEKLQARAGEKTQSVGAPAVTERSRRQKERNRRFLPRHWELSLLLFNPRSDRVAPFTIRWRLQWQRVRCAPPAVRSDDKSFAEFWEEFSAATDAVDSCSGGL